MVDIIRYCAYSSAYYMINIEFDTFGLSYLPLMSLYEAVYFGVMH